MGKSKQSDRTKTDSVSSDGVQKMKVSSKNQNGKKLYRMWKKQSLEKKLEKEEVKAAKEAETKLSSSKNNKGIKYTVSIAVPGSIMSNAQSPALKTYLAGQIARAAAIFQVDEVVIFDDTGITRSFGDEDMSEEEKMNFCENKQDCIQMGRILQYLECPQYLRKYLFPIQNYLEYAGVLNPLDGNHHLRETDSSLYREGVVLNKPAKPGHSIVNVGLHKEVFIDKEIQTGVRVTVKLLNADSPTDRRLKGTVVAPNCPRIESGLYWGYNVRLAHSLGAVLTECPYEDGYDLTIGTSDKGDSVESYHVPEFKHMLIVFGGLAGLEASLEADEGLHVDDITVLFKAYLNTCPHQGTRVIRTEEAILITMAVLSSKWMSPKLKKLF